MTDLQTHVGEVPDRTDSAGDHGIGHLLSESGRHTDDSDAHLKASHQLFKPFHAENAPPMNLGADLAGISVKGRDDLQSVLFEPLVAQECAAERTGTGQNRLRSVVPVQIALDRLDQLLDLVTDSGLAGNAGDGQILADDDFSEIHIAGQFRRRNNRNPRFAHLGELVQIGGQPTDRRKFLNFYIRHESGPLSLKLDADKFL